MNSITTEGGHTVAALEHLTTQVLLVAPSLRIWAARYQLPSEAHATVELAGEHIATGAGLTVPQVKLLNDERPVDSSGRPWKKRFRSLETAKDQLLDRMSLSFPIRGVRMIPRRHAGVFFDKLFGPTVGSVRALLAREDLHEADRRRYQEMLDTADPGAGPAVPLRDASREEQSLAHQLGETVREFVADYANIYRQMSEHEAWSLVSERVPTRGADVRGKFALECVPVALSTSLNEGTGQVTGGAMADYADAVRASVQQRVEEAIDSLIAEPRDRLATAVAELQALIGRQGRVTSRSFNPIRSAIEQIRQFQFVADDRLLEQIRRLEAGLEQVRPASLTAETTASSGLGALLTNVVQAANDEAARASSGRRMRSIG